MIDDDLARKLGDAGVDLGHAKPAERIQAGRGDEVLAVIAELRDGAFG